MADFKGARKPGGFGGGSKFKGGGSRGGFGGGRSNFGDRGDRGGSRGGFDREMFSAVCCDCGKACEVPFRPSAGKQVRCSSCFEQHDGGGQRGDRDFKSQTRSNSFESRGDKKMFQAVCADCGSSCEVPFRPFEGKKVLCDNCFHGNGGPSVKPAMQSIPNYKEQFEMLSSKIDKILYLLNTTKTVEKVKLTETSPVSKEEKKVEAKTEKAKKVEEPHEKELRSPVANKKVVKVKKVEVVKVKKVVKKKK